MGPKKDPGKKKKGKIFKDKTSAENLLEIITANVLERLKKEKWADEDKQNKKNKMPKKDRKKVATRRQEELKLAIEAEKIRLAQEEKRRIEEERRQAIEKEQRDQVEQGIRLEQLGWSCKKIKKIRYRFYKSEIKDLEDCEWEQYMKCDGLPDPSDCGQMHTFLHLWDHVRENTTVEMAKQKSTEVISLLEILDDFMDNTSVSAAKQQAWIEVRDSFRTYQTYNLDCATYRLIRDIEKELVRLDIPTAQLITTHEHFAICLWALVQLPIPMYNPKRIPRPRIELLFWEIRMNLTFPENLDTWAMCIRGMYVKYDHFSHLSRSYADPIVPDQLYYNLCKSTTEEYEKKVTARDNIRSKILHDFDEAAKHASAGFPPGSEEHEHILQQTQKKKNEYIKVDTSEIYLNDEDDSYDVYRDQMDTLTFSNVINLRRYRILGGVFFLDLFYQPPQPTTMVLHNITLSTLQVPKWLEEVNFHYYYEPPSPPMSGVVRKPEEIEEEIKLQEAEFDNMILLEIVLPKHVLWLDVPRISQWDDEKKEWYTSDIHDVKYNEERPTVTFRTGRFGPIAMAVYRYNSMPYQAWEMKPCNDGTVILTLMAAVLVIEFTVKNHLVCVSQLQNAPTEALDDLIGVYYKLPKLKRILQKGGVDVFPEPDAFCYMEGVCEKHWNMEFHLYYNMAQISLCYNFGWSRWNLLAGRRKIVMQIRESTSSERVKMSDYSMLMVTPLKALLVNCTEVSQTFSEEGIDKMKFYPDFYHLVIGTVNLSTKKKIEKIPTDLISTVARLLIATRICSLS